MITVRETQEMRGSINQFSVPQLAWPPSIWEDVETGKKSIIVILKRIWHIITQPSIYITPPPPPPLFSPIPVSFRLGVKLVLAKFLVWRECLKEEPLISALPAHDPVALNVHDAIGGRVAHLAVVKELVDLEDAVAALPRADPVALLVDPAVAVGILDGEGAEADVVSSASRRKVHRFLRWKQTEKGGRGEGETEMARAAECMTACLNVSDCDVMVIRFSGKTMYRIAGNFRGT